MKKKKERGKNIIKRIKKRAKPRKMKAKQP